MARRATNNDLPTPRSTPGSALSNFTPPAGAPKLDQKLDDTKGSIDVPASYVEPLARLVLDRFNRAKRWRANERLHNTTVETVLNRCWRQVEGEIDPCTAEMIEATGVDLNLNLTLLKVEAFEAWARSIITDSLEMPWTVDPTEIPELSKAARDEVLMSLKARIFDEAQAMPTDLPSLVRQMKAEQMEAERKHAALAAKKMSSLMKDQAQEGGFREAMIAFIRDFATYPYAVLEGPCPVVKTVLEWRGNRLVPTQKLVIEARRRSPFDLFWSSDSPDTQRGSYVVLRDKMTRSKLFQAALAKSYIGKNVLAALEHYSRNDVSRDWLNPNPERSSNVMWPSEETIDVLTMYGLFSADELRPYGLQVHDGQFYEAKVKTIGPYCVQVHISRNPNPFTRPVYTASMSTNGDKIPGTGLAQKLRDIERGYHAALRGMVRNVHYSSGPIGEVDYSRIARWIGDDNIGSFDPYTVMPVDPDIAGGGRPAHYFHTVPNVAGQMIQVMQFFEHVADRHSQIPAAFHGEAVGSGVNRTFRGVTLLQGNALKGVQAALTNMGRGAIQPFATNLFVHNMLYSDDDAVKGDSKVLVADIAGLLEREVKKQQTLENLQLVAQVAQAGAAPPAALAWATEEALLAAGVPLERFQKQVEQGMGLGGGDPMENPGGPPALGSPAGPQPEAADGGVSAPNLSSP